MALRTGDMLLKAVGQDVVLVTRAIAEADVFGRPGKPEVQALAVNRAAEIRRIEYEGRTVELPPESAVWLEAGKAEKK